MEYKTKVIRGDSPLNDLSEEQLMVLANWSETETYKILSTVITEGTLKKVAKLLRTSKINDGLLLDLARQQGEYLQLQSILNFPNLATAILKDNSEAKKESK